MGGFELPSAGSLFASLIFSTIGFGIFIYGKKQAQMKSLAIGIVLMVFPYFVSQAWLVWTLGIALCAAVFIVP